MIQTSQWPKLVILIFLAQWRTMNLTWAQNNKTPEEYYSFEQKPWTKFLGIRSHYPNYLIPFNYDFRPHPNVDRKRSEAKFQFSLKKRIITSLIYSGDVYVGYTQQSFWQVWDEEYSRPFRESNYAPEVFLTLPGWQKEKGVELKRWRLGLVHESNGQRVPESRSWNRAYVQMLFGMGAWSVDLKLWKRISESNKKSRYHSTDDDNPDITYFMGPGELQLAYQWMEHVWVLHLRNSMRFSSLNRGAVGLDWTYPIHGDAPYLYLQLFRGFGESLMDYNRSVSKVGIGFMLSR